MSVVIGASAAKQFSLYQEAVTGFTASPDKATSIEIMLELALHGTNPTLRLWAETFLLEKLGIAVLHDDIQETDHATPPASENLRR